MAPERRGERGTIDRFSAASRRRLMERLIRLDWARQEVWFITLTYPGEYDDNPRSWKENLSAFRTWLGRRYGDSFTWAIWRLEFQRRGAPHYHIVAGIRLGTDLRGCRDDVRVSWSRILGLSAVSGDFARVDVQRAELSQQDGYGKLMTYLCKYVGKRQTPKARAEPLTGEVLPIGRMWGVWGKPPLQAPQTLNLTAHDYLTLIRRLRRRYRRDPFLSKANVGWHSFLAYVPAASMRQLMRGLCVDR